MLSHLSVTPTLSHGSEAWTCGRLMTSTIFSQGSNFGNFLAFCLLVSASLEVCGILHLPSFYVHLGC